MQISQLIRMKMSLKYSLGLAFLCTLVGIYAGTRIKKDEPQAPQMAQKQAQTCEAVVKRSTAKDGTVTESVSFRADSTQSQEVKPVQSSSLGLSVAVFKDKQLNIGYKIGEISLLKWKIETEILGKIEKYDDLNSNKEIGLGFRF